MKQFSCPDCKVTMDTCKGCQRYCSKEKESNIYPSYPQPFKLPNTYAHTPYEYECCKDCSNSPANGGSGICTCTLPYFEKGITYNNITNATTITSTTRLINNTTPNNGENV